MPHPPQLRMSLLSFTHAPLQQVSPVPQVGLQVPPLLEALLLDEVVVVVVVVVVVLGMQQARHAGL